MEFCIKLNIIAILIIYVITVCIGSTIKDNKPNVKSGSKCQLQEQYCDVMDPNKQCCPGTSCGVRRNGDHVSNLCVRCRDLGQPCTANDGRQCCSGLVCQQITEYASVCNPKSHKPFVPKSVTQNSYDYYDNRKYQN